MIGLRLSQISGLLAALAGKRNTADPIAAADLAPDVAELIAASGKISRGAIAQLFMRSNVANPTTQVDVTLGQARSRFDDMDLVLPAGMTKRLDLEFAPGTGNGMRDEALAIQANATYHVHLVGKANGDTDLIGSRSPDNPNLSGDYVSFRRIGSMVTDAAAAIRPFRQEAGGWFKLLTRSLDYATQANGGGPFLRTVSAPAGLPLEVEFTLQSVGTASPGWSGLFSPQNGLPVPFGQPTQWAQIRRASDSTYLAAIVRQFINSNAQIYTFSNDTGDVIVLGVLGWCDPREDYL